MWMVAVMVLAASQQQVPEVHAEAAFALSNQAGDQLLVWNESPAPRELVHAFCAEGRTLGVRWIGHQEAGKASRGRQTGHVFTQVKGEIFRASPALPATDVDHTCLLTTASFARARVMQAVRGSGECDAATRERLSRAKGRPLAACWNKGGLGSERQVVLVLFEPQGNSLLASLAVLGGAEIAWDDYPAEGHKGQISCWRVDDGCEFPPDAIDVLFGYVLESGGFGLAVTWGGPEGQALTLLEGQGSQLRALLQTTRYWSPL